MSFWNDEETLREIAVPYEERRQKARNGAAGGDFDLNDSGFWGRNVAEYYAEIIAKTDEQFAAEDAAKLASIEERKNREEHELLLRRLREFSIPNKDHERLAAGVGDTQAVQAALGAVESGVMIVVLSGRRGCGKTVAAGRWLLGMAAAWDARSDKFRYGNGGGLFLDATKLARWSRYNEEEMTRLERVGALVVDDLGIEYDDKHGAFRSFVDGLINARYSNSVPTLITTNLPANDFQSDGQKVEGFKSRYGERVADRIREVGKFVELRGDSMRSKQQ